ncbi:MAG TPA: BTAD domain-containing putative transcriptional regulator, partial [Chloroflexota bacterium]
ELTADHPDAAEELGLRLQMRSPEPNLRAIGHAMVALVRSCRLGPLGDARTALLEATKLQERDGHTHYLGISYLNLACVERAMGNPVETLEAASRAVELLASTSAGPELASAKSARIWGLAHLGQLDTARSEAMELLANAPSLIRAEVRAELADVEAEVGDLEDAFRFINLAEPPSAEAVGAASWHASAAHLLLAARRVDEACELVGSLPARQTGDPGHESRRLLIDAELACLTGASRAMDALDVAVRASRDQGAGRWHRRALLVRGTLLPSPDCDAAVARVAHEHPPSMSSCAEFVASRLGSLSLSTLSALQAEVRAHPGRWRPALRRSTAAKEEATAARAAAWLDEVGSKGDIPLLRKLSKTFRNPYRDPDLGRRLARRLALPVFVEDQGRVVIRIGDEERLGTSIRRKVLALLCFLLTRPEMSATRDQVLDALWPDLAPDLALNSLNQTTYFLRRVFEPHFIEDHSPGYVHHTPDLVWLDSELVSSRSRACALLMTSLPAHPRPDEIEKLVTEYRGRFAMDFAYEDWASAYRDGMHAAYLEAVEDAMVDDTNAGHFDRAIGLARRGLSVDPDAEQLELGLLRLYRRTGAHAAAAEQYQHYAAYLRSELGVEPPPLTSI